MKTVYGIVVKQRHLSDWLGQELMVWETLDDVMWFRSHEITLLFKDHVYLFWNSHACQRLSCLPTEIIALKQHKPPEAAVSVLHYLVFQAFLLWEESLSCWNKESLDMFTSVHG